MRPTAGGASRHADENGRRNANAGLHSVCVATAVFVSEARFAGRSHAVPLRALPSLRLNVFFFVFSCFRVFRDLRGKAVCLYCVMVHDAGGFDRDPPEVFVRCALADTMNEMLAIRYETPQSVGEAVRLMAADPGAHVLAGGTDLLVQFRAGMRRPSAFVDVKRIPELVSITIDSQGLRLGAATAAAVIGEHAELRRLWPGLAESVGLIGSTQIQGRGSVGGNLCNASPAADTTCALIVNRAECVIAGPNGERVVPVDEFCIAPGRTVLERGELLVALRVPRPAARTSDAYLRLIPRSEMDIAVAGAAVSVALDAKGVCTSARVAIGAVAPTALRVPEAEKALVGSPLDEASLKRAAAAASAAARPIGDKRGTAAYRRTIAGVLTRRAAAIAAQRARGN